MKYELIVLFHPDLEIDLEKPLEKVEKIINKLGGKIEKTDNWGKRKLAYPIAKQEFAIYVYYEFTIDSEKITKLDSTLNITDEVIRHLITKYVEAPAPDEKEDEAKEAATTEKEVDNG